MVAVNPLFPRAALPKQQRPITIASGEDFSRFNTMYYLKGALAGGICCGVTHGALTPVDVVKTRMQLDPVKYNKGMIGGFRQVIAGEGAGALLTGLGPTVSGYFVQGWFKFGGVEFFKIQAAKALGDEKAWNNRNGIYLGAAAIAEFIADIFLCPLEATRIRLVSNPTYAPSMMSAMTKMASEEGVIGGFYAGFGPILFKQVPYTMAKFAVQGKVAEMIYDGMKKQPSELSGSANVGVSLSSGVVAGVAAAVISHPADTLLSKVNKAGAGGSGGIVSRLMNIAVETGAWKLCTQGLGARCVMIGTLTAGQFGIFDSVMSALGASKFHFHDPSKGH
uniref:Mitochondrial phosphate carrier protein n=2 Tax=Hemiselmis andersenii TaxID=464988 RepID=A0A7S1HBC3_HEMAN